MKVAVYVAGEVPATMLCVWAPPSDHDIQRYADRPIVCGEGALIVSVDPTITVTLNGAVRAVPPTTRLSPAPLGFAVKVSVVVCG